MGTTKRMPARLRRHVTALCVGREWAPWFGPFRARALITNLGAKGEESCSAPWWDSLVSLAGRGGRHKRRRSALGRWASLNIPFRCFPNAVFVVDAAVWGDVQLAWLVAERTAWR